MDFSDILDSKSFNKKIDNLFARLSTGKGSILGWVVVIVAAFFVVKNAKSATVDTSTSSKEYSDE